MKTLGLIGGMSWESTVSYYRTINRVVGERRGGLHSAPLLLYSVEFAEVEAMQRAGRWEELGAMLAGIACRLEAAGAQVLVICANTMHKVADAVEAAVEAPLVHVADVTAARVREAGLSKVGMLGTRFTMDEGFLRERLEAAGLDVTVPPAEERREVDRVIFEELCRGQVREASRARYRQVVTGLADRGAEGVVLACTEIALLLRPEDADVPLFDTAAIHAEAAALRALGEVPAG